MPTFLRERRAGSVLVIDEQQRLSGIFTGRDAVRMLAEGKDAGSDHPGAGDDAGSNHDDARIQSRSLPIVAQSTRCGR